MTSDTDLARMAQGGDAAALGMLLERHRARLLAHALQLLGHGPDAQDAVQDTFLVALRKFGALRAPEQAEGWLHTVLRSVCLSRLRGRTELGDPPEVAAPHAESPEAAIEALALRDWVWTAVGRLSEPLRLVTMLRHFSACNAYEDIANVCGVPVGTVRSRLAEARRRLADDLLLTAQRAHGDAARHAEAERQRVFSSFEGVGYADYLDAFADDVAVRFDHGPGFRGRYALAAGIGEDLEAGVGHVPVEVIAGPGITILELRFRNPPDKPAHCPPAMTQVHFIAEGETRGMAWHYAARPAGEPGPAV